MGIKSENKVVLSLIALFQTSPATDKSDNDEPELKINENPTFESWKGLAAKNGNGHAVVGHQLSALLAQNGHGNAVS